MIKKISKTKSISVRYVKDDNDVKPTEETLKFHETCYASVESHCSKKFYLGTDIDFDNLTYGTHIRGVKNCLILGNAGTGKTVFINKQIQHLCSCTNKEYLKVVLCSRFSDEYKYIRTKYNEYILNKINKDGVCDEKYQVEQVKQAISLFESRINEIHNNGFETINDYNLHLESNDKDILPDVVVFVDEYADLIAFDNSLITLMNVAIKDSWKAGIHFVLASQSINAFTDEMIENVGTKICFQTSNGAEAYRFIGVNSPVDGNLMSGDMWVYQPTLWKLPKHLKCEYPKEN